MSRLERLNQRHAIGGGKYSPAHLNGHDLRWFGLPAGVSASEGRKSLSALSNQHLIYLVALALADRERLTVNSPVQVIKLMSL